MTVVVVVVVVVVVECAGVFESIALVGATDITLDVGATSGGPHEFIDALDVDGLSTQMLTLDMDSLATNRKRSITKPQQLLLK